MQIGIVGLGRRGANMMLRLTRDRHACAVFDSHPQSIETAAKDGALPDDIRRAEQLTARSIHYVDVGTSGGVWGSERGYCLMVGGDAAVVERIDPILHTLAPGVDAAPRMIAALVPAPGLNAALTERFISRGEEDFANKILSALRHEFGGHVEKTS